MAFRNEELALAERVDSLQREVDHVREELRERDAANAPSRLVAWLLQPHVVMGLIVMGTVAMLPAGQMLHRKAAVRVSDELRPAQIRAAARAAAPEIARKCMAPGVFNDFDVWMSVDEAGNVVQSDVSGGRGLTAEAALCINRALPHSVPSGSRPIDVTMKLRLYREEGAR